VSNITHSVSELFVFDQDPTLHAENLRKMLLTLSDDINLK
jgi:hypothetical protein